MTLTGFGNYHQTESIAGALPKNQNSPLHCGHGLYAEQMSFSAFTRPRHINFHSWLYRRAPSVVHTDFVPYKSKNINETWFKKMVLQAPNPYRWSPLPKLTESLDFVHGLFPIAGNVTNNAYIYQCNKSMTDTYFSNHDGELLFVPFLGQISLQTEFGEINIKPGMIALIPRGVIFKVILQSDEAEGYLCENGGLPFVLPSLGLIGSNGLANPRHFIYPQAFCENYFKPVEVLCKSQQALWVSEYPHSPLNVLAWHGNYAPYSYDLSLFNTINTVSFDHPDPSIFTVLTSENAIPGVANLDFVIFPPRWTVAEHTFRPPYFHRNIMSEFMGLITGTYDAKQEGFLPGGVSIHNCMTAHGPDRQNYQSMSNDTNENLKPDYIANTLAFMFETHEPWLIYEEAFRHVSRQEDYSSCWQALVTLKPS